MPELVDAKTTQYQPSQPQHGIIEHADHVGAIHLISVEILPDIVKIAHALAKTARIYRQRRSIKRTRRCSANYRERVMRAARQEFGDRLEHTDLISGPRAATRKDQPCALFHSRPIRPLRVPIPARLSAFLPAMRSAFPTASRRHPPRLRARLSHRCSPPAPPPRPPP